MKILQQRAADFAVALPLIGLAACACYVFAQFLIVSPPIANPLPRAETSAVAKKTPRTKTIENTRELVKEAVARAVAFETKRIDTDVFDLNSKGETEKSVK